VPLGPLRAGDPTRVGAFRLAARVGAGGMGVVFLGVPDGPVSAASGSASSGAEVSGPAGAGLVAVKLVHARIAALPDYRARFRREVAAARVVAGTCTARVLAADAEAPRPWLATEYVAGPSLAEVVGLGGRLSAAPTEALAVGLAEALVAIHRAGVVHRDLKPANVLVTATGPKLIDFGMARPLPEAGDVTASEVTRAGAIVGSPGYLAPEQADVGSRVGPAADVWAWALTVAFAATGRPVFGVGSAEALLYRSMHLEPDLAGVPDRLLPAVRAALARDPARRPSAAALLAGLVGDAADPVSATARVLDRLWGPDVAAWAGAVPGVAPVGVPAVSAAAASWPPGQGAGPADWSAPARFATPPPGGPAGDGLGTLPPGRGVVAAAGGRYRRWTWVVAVVLAGLAGAGISAAATRGGGQPVPRPTVVVATSRPVAGASLPASPGVTGLLDGRWTGSYVCRQGVTALQLDIMSVPAAPGLVTAVFTFGPSPDNPNPPSGAFTMSGMFEGDQLTLAGDVWIERPLGYSLVGLAGTYSSVGVQQIKGQVRGTGCGTFTVQKAS